MLARPTLSQLRRVCIDAPVLHDSRDLSARVLSFKVCTVKESKEGRAGSLAGKPEPANVGTEILMHLQRCGRRPVGVAAVGPWLCSPAWVHERSWLGDILLREHLAQNFHCFLLSLLVCLALSSVGKLVGHGYEDDVGIREESGSR